MAGVKRALGTQFRTQRLQVGQIAYNAGQVGSLDIPRGLLLKSLKLRLSGSVAIGTAAITSIYSENPLTLLQRIELVADGKKPFVSADGQMLYRLNQILNQKLGEISFNVNSGTVATHTFTAYLTIDAAAMRTLSPNASWLDTRAYDKLSLNVTWAAGFMLGANPGTATLAFTGTVLDVQAEYTTEGFENVYFRRLLIQDEIPVTATSNSLRLTVPRNGLLRGILFRTMRDGVLVDDLINNVSLRSENSVMHMDHLTWATMQAANVNEYQLESLNTTYANGTYLSGSARMTGYGYHELIEQYAIPTALDTASLNTLDLIFDVTHASGTELIRVCYEYFETAGR